MSLQPELPVRLRYPQDHAARGLIQLVLLAVWWEPRHAASGMTMSHEDPVQHSDGRSTKALHVDNNKKISLT